MTQFSLSFFLSALVSLFLLPKETVFHTAKYRSKQLAVNSEQRAVNSEQLISSTKELEVRSKQLKNKDLLTNASLATNESILFTEDYLLCKDTPPPDSTENPNDRIGDATTQETVSPMWLQNPTNMVTTYELAPDGKGYYIYEKIGGINVRPPSYITFEDYIKLHEKKLLSESMREAALANNKETKKGLIPNIEIGKLDDIFGGGPISIQPTGNVALNFSLDRNVIRNPSLPIRQQRNQYFNFDPQIQVGVLGQIGDKLKLNISQDTKASFDFENISNVNFKGNEDQIIQTLDVGAVTLPLGNTLIQGSSNIFGIKAGLKFGPVTMTVLTGVDRGQRQTMSIQGGVVETQYKKSAADYDQNRHFFLSHYFRSKYDESLSRLPQIVSRYRINQLEVWVSNPNLSQTSNLRPGVGFVDLGENDLPVANGHGVIFNKINASTPAVNSRYPGNDANDLYSRLKIDPNLRNKSLAPTILENQFHMTNAVDFQLVNLRKLQEGKDYTYNPQLGFVSMSSQLQSDEILFVAFSYTLDDIAHQVGEFSNDVAADTLNTKPLFLKMIRPAQLRPTYNNAVYPPWDLMMKNFYSIGYGLKPDGFKMQVMYESGTRAGKVNFLPEPKDSTAKNIPLLQLLDMDKLTNNTAPEPDNLFDYIEGLTVNTDKGYIMIPHLEPFGTHLARRMHNGVDDSTRYCFQPLYDMTYQDAIQKFTQLNRYSFEGSYQGGGNSNNNTNNPSGIQQSGAEIPLNGFNIQPNQVTITANGIKLQQGVDYEVDPSGTKAIIKNPAYIGKGQDLQVSIDQNSTFQMQTKTIVGTRLEYSPLKNTKMGFTALRLNERPMNIKTTIGDEPVRNSVIGLDVASQRELPFITKALDWLPLLSTKAPSNMNFSGEIAQFIPGQPKQVQQDSLRGVTYLDDFEAAKLPYNMMGGQRWKLASFPKYQPSTELFDPKTQYALDTLAPNYSRAKFSWYSVDPQVYNRQYADIPDADRDYSYTRLITQNEIFPTITTLQGSSYQPTMDLRYQPSKRGPYNYQTDSLRVNSDGGLSIPYENWAGIMADINTNTDFEAQNVEFIEFWLLDPFLDNFKGNNGGELVFNLGNISEDVIPDNLQFFENGLPEAGGNSGIANTPWGRVPTSIPPSNAFGNEAKARENQDVGLEGLSTEAERTFFQKYLDKLAATYGTNSGAYTKFQNDPSTDDYTHYLNKDFNTNKTGILDRYENTYGTEKNSPIGQTNNGLILQGSQYPDTEDLNRNGTPNMWEEYWEYKIKIDKAHLVPGQNYVVDRVTRPVPLNTGNTRFDTVTWYQFRIPINSGKAVNNIPNFKVINFMRMYMTHFNEETMMRLADFQLVSTQWRKYDGPMTDVSPSPNPTEPPFASFEVGSVSFQDNSNKLPFNYVKPPGVFQQGMAGNTQQGFLQDERSLTMKVCGLPEGDGRAIFKNVTQDLRNYKNLRMFVHSEYRNDGITPPSSFDQKGDAVAFIRLGLDNDLNYYEYEIPLTPSDPNAPNLQSAENIWKDQFFFALELLTTAKDARNKASFGILDRFLYENGLPQGHKIYVKGTPKLSDIHSIMIGVRNPKNPGEGPLCMEVWMDELSLTSFNQSSAWAANANLNLTLADFGTIQASLQEKKAGFGTLDQRISQRTREDVFKYSAMGDFQLHKLLPQKWGINLPVHLNQDEQFGNPVYDPRQADVLTKNMYKGLSRDSVRAIKTVIQTYQRNRGFAFNNIKKNKTGTGGKSHLWDIENIDASFAYSDQLGRNYMSEKMYTNTYRGSLNYRYTVAKPINIQPFKKWKHKNPISELNFSPLPKSVTVSLIGDRQFSENLYRATSFGGITTPVYTKNFVLTRNYQLAWDLTKSLSLNFNAANNARVDEVKGYWNETDQNYRDSIGRWTDNFLHVGQDTINTKYIMQNGQPYQRVYNRKITMGRTIGYNHNVNMAYTLPFNKFKLTDWVTGNITYAGTFQWLNPPEVNKGLGSTVINSKNLQSQGRLDFDALYGKNKALKKYLDAAPYKAPPAPPKSTAPPLKDKNGKEIKPPKPPKVKPPVIINPDWKDAHKLNPPPEYKIFKALLRGMVRLIFSVKNADIAYNQTAGTTLPGYLGVNDNLGADFIFRDTTTGMNNSKSPIVPPTWGFLAGSQQDIRSTAARYGWISKDTTLSNYWARNITTQLTVKAALQPLPGFKIDVTATRNQTENESEMFRWSNQNTEYGHTDQQFSGTYSVSYIFINTAFGKSNKGAFEGFSTARKDISERLYFANTSRVFLPTNVNIPNDILADGYHNGYARTSQEVLLPAFLAGYGIIKSDKIGTSAFPNIPLPNWSVNFTPMTAFPQMKQTFTAFTIKHNYRGTYTVGSYTRNLNAKDIDKDGYADNYVDAGTDVAGNPMVNFNPIKNIPLAQIQEQMSPLIGVNTTLKSGMNINMAYGKTRTMTFNVGNLQMTEEKSDDFSFTLGYRKDKLNWDIHIFNKDFALKNSANLNCTVTVKDNYQKNYNLDGGPVNIVRGNLVANINPSVDYVISNKLQIKAFWQQNITRPHTSLSYPNSFRSVGVQIRFMLN